MASLRAFTVLEMMRTMVAAATTTHHLVLVVCWSSSAWTVSIFAPVWLTRSSRAATSWLRAAMFAFGSSGKAAISASNSSHNFIRSWCNRACSSFDSSRANDRLSSVAAVALLSPRMYLSRARAGSSPRRSSNALWMSMMSRFNTLDQSRSYLARDRERGERSDYASNHRIFAQISFLDHRFDVAPHCHGILLPPAITDRCRARCHAQSGPGFDSCAGIGSRGSGEIHHLPGRDGHERVAGH